MCVHIPLRLNPIASLVWLGKPRPPAMPPALILTTLVWRKEKRKKNKFYIYLDVTHTHRVTRSFIELLHCHLPYCLTFLLGRSDNQAPSRPKGDNPPVFSPVSLLSITAGERPWDSFGPFCWGFITVLPQCSALEISKNGSLAEPSLRKKHLEHGRTLILEKEVQYISTGEGLRTLLA